MAPVCAAYCGNIDGMIARSQPVGDLGANGATYLSSISGFHGTRFAGDDQHHARAHGPGLSKSVHQPDVSLIQAGPVQVQAEVRLQATARDSALP